MTRLAGSLTRREFIIRGAAAAGGALLLNLGPWGSQPDRVDAQAGTGKIYLPLVSSGPSGPRVMQVGPGRSYKTPSAAAAVAQDGDVVEIDAGLYSGDVAFWKTNNLTLRGVGGGTAHLDANGKNAGGKAIWVIQGNNTTVENIEFSGAAVPDQNGAGIRQEGTNLTLRFCYFHDNENGLLTSANAASEILIETSEFAHNGRGDGYTHNLYIGTVGKFTLQYCYSHHSTIGHLVKSRALENHILYNRLTCEASGNSSYELDLPDGGLSYVIGNLIQQGPNTDNSTIVAYNEEHQNISQIQEIYLINNTLVNDRANGTFVNVGGTAIARASNNMFIGSGAPLQGVSSQDHNLQLGPGTLVDEASYNYHLAPGSPAIGASADPGAAHGTSLTPTWQYVHPRAREARLNGAILDVGAYAA